MHASSKFPTWSSLTVLPNITSSTYFLFFGKKFYQHNGFHKKAFSSTQGECSSWLLIFFRGWSRDGKSLLSPVFSPSSWYWAQTNTSLWKLPSCEAAAPRLTFGLALLPRRDLDRGLGRSCIVLNKYPYSGLAQKRCSLPLAGYKPWTKNLFLGTNLD